MNALVLVNGELYKPGCLRRRIRQQSFDLVIGADRGSRHARVLEVTLNAIVGDMDSLTSSERQKLGQVAFITFPEEKDETDLELALLYAVQKGARRIVMVGILGGRMDMTLANLLMMNLPALAGHRVEVWHGDQTGWLIRPPGEIVNGAPGDTVSLIPLTMDVSEISLQGFKYPLRRERLIFGQGRGLSNQLAGLSGRVDISDGLILAVHTPGRA